MPWFDYSHYLVNFENKFSSFALILWLEGLFLVIKLYNFKKCYKLFNVYLIGELLVVLFSSISGFSRITDYFLIVNVPLLFILLCNRKKVISLETIFVLGCIVLNLYKVFTIFGWL